MTEERDTDLEPETNEEQETGAGDGQECEPSATSGETTPRATAGAESTTTIGGSESARRQPAKGSINIPATQGQGDTFGTLMYLDEDKMFSDDDQATQ